jgi:CDP-diacylglycerol--serine O-phosphatidyltransferase
MKKVYLLPNLLTTGNFLCGVVSMGLSMQGHFHKAALFILVAMIFDFLDGQVARLSKATTKFGEEYDSLSDLVTFGIAPMVMIYEMTLIKLGRLGLSIGFIYAVCCALRLARYNAKLDGRTKTCFVGLPSPASAGLIATSVLASSHIEGFVLLSLVPLLMIVAGFLMVSTFEYPSVKTLVLVKKGPFLYLVAGVVSLTAFILLGEEISLFLGFLLYAMGGIIYDRFLKDRFKTISSEEPYPKKLGGA